MGSCVKRYISFNKSACSTGRRATIHYPAGGTYAGYWLCNKHHGWGVKTSALRSSSYYADKKKPEGQLIYEGNWVQNKRQGCGSMLRRHGTNVQVVYAGVWHNDMKFGEGKQFYTDGCIYFGNWLQNRRHGLGIQWYKNGDIYLGEWKTDCKHGLGVMLLANGNRYEGHFARGYKNGEGIYYHMNTGQIQKGMWENGNCKVSVMQDESIRAAAKTPTIYPIPRNSLKYPNEIMRELFQRYKPLGKKPPCCFNAAICLEFVHRSRQFGSYEERYATPSKLNVYPDVPIVCTCEPVESLVRLDGPV